MVNNFALSSMFGALAGVAVLAANFLSGVVVARMLGVAGAGDVAYFVWLVFLLAPAVDLGLPAAMTRYVPEFQARGDHPSVLAVREFLLRRLMLALAGTAAVLALLAVGAPWLQTLVASGVAAADLARSQWLWVLLCTLLGAQVLATFTYAALKGEQRFDAVLKLAGVSLPLQVGGTAAGAALFGVTGALVGYVAGQALPALYALKLRKGPALEPALRERVVRYARNTWLANVAAAFVWSKIEVLFLARAWGSEAVGLFSVALALTSLASQGPVMLTNAILPMMSAHRGRDDDAAIQIAYSTGTRLLALMVFPACLGMAAITADLLPGLYGDAFSDAVPAAILLACASAVSSTTVVGSQLVYAMDRTDFFMKAHLAGAVASVLVGLLAIPSFGLMGAAVGRAAIQIALNVALAIFIERRLRMTTPYGALARLFAAATVSALAAAAVSMALDGALSTALAIVAAGPVYIVALRLFRALPTGDLAMLGRLAAAMPGPARRVSGLVIDFVAGGRPQTAA